METATTGKGILYVPLDERPCNYRYPRYIAGIGGAELFLPPKEMLGKFKRPAQVDALWDWVFDQTGRAGHIVLSMDMMIYGGIVPSRLHQLPSQVCADRRQRLERLRQRFPGAQLYAFQLITRAPARNGSGEEPDYYEAHGYDIFRYGVVSDKESLGRATPEDLAEKQAILGRVPGPDLEDFLRRRKANFQNNIAMLEMAARGVVDHLIIPLDDCFEYGYAPAERRGLAEKAAQLGILSKISLYPGADEMGCTLVARALCNQRGIQPSVWTEYSSGTGRLVIPPYEDRSIGETVPHHIRNAGGREAFSPESADIALMVNPPTAFSNRIKFELDRRKLYVEPERNLNRFLDRMKDHLAQKRICAVADSAVPDGADECLMTFLQEQDLLNRIHCFSGWNTSSNAMGTAVAHAMALACAKKGSLAGGESARLSQEFRTLRYLEDWGYMTHVRQDVSEQVAAGAYGPGMDVRYLGAQTPAIAREVTRLLEAFAQKRLGGIPYVLQASLPWQRMFEVELELQPR